jgi:hypothetical protein
MVLLLLLPLLLILLILLLQEAPFLVGASRPSVAILPLILA